jgi:hypothetical protein
MKLLAGVIAGLLLGTISVAGASTEGASMHANGVWCKAASGSVACVRENGSGYGIGISRDLVMVMNLDTSRRVFLRYQP